MKNKMTKIQPVAEMTEEEMAVKLAEDQQVRDLTEELRVVIKDAFVASVRKIANGLKMKFPDGNSFFINIWKIKDGE